MKRSAEHSVSGEPGKKKVKKKVKEEKIYQGRKVVMFYSGAKEPVCSLSNFRECNLSLEGKEYPSTEHWYQSRKASGEDTAAEFRGEGVLTAWGTGMARVCKKDTEKKIAFWSKKRNIGVIAKMAARSYPLKPELELRTLAEAQALWCPALKAKALQNSLVLKTLMATPDDSYLLEFSRGAKRTTLKGSPPKWSGLVEDGKLYGRNWMGLCWMKVKAELSAGASLNLGKGDRESEVVQVP
jgi:hypothetical protein